MRKGEYICAEILELSSELRYAILIDNNYKGIKYVWI